MRKVVASLLLIVTLVACSPSDPTASNDTVESLVANPERLKELRERCRLERAKLGDVLCNRVAEATNRRFFGDGKVPYNPQKESPKF